MIVYPAIDLRRGRCVRLVQGDPKAETVFSEDPANVAGRWVDEGAEWLHVVNLDGAIGDSPSEGKNLEALGSILESVNVPVQFGGGLRALEDIESMLSLGVSRVILGTVALKDPDIVYESVRRFGSERIALAIDVRDGLVATHGWQQLTEWTAVELALKMKQLGLQRIIHTDISRDGMFTGVNASACAALAEQAGMAVIASGGVASVQDVDRVKEVEESGVDGIIIGKALYTGKVDLREALAAA